MMESPWQFNSDHRMFQPIAFIIYKHNSCYAKFLVDEGYGLKSAMMCFWYSLLMQ